MKNKNICHITHIANLPSILQQGGLCCDNLTRERGLAPKSIAYQNLKDRRTHKVVPVAKGGTLADYVPFYFAPRSPMLYAIHNHKVDVYNGRQNDIIHLVSSIEEVQRYHGDNPAHQLAYAFTDGHAIQRISKFFDNLRDLEQKIDWKIMKEKYWRDTVEDNDRGRRRQAEFLVHWHAPWALIRWIGVIDEHMKHRVEAILEMDEHRLHVLVKPEWYY